MKSVVQYGQCGRNRTLICHIETISIAFQRILCDIGLVQIRAGDNIEVYSLIDSNLIGGGCMTEFGKILFIPNSFPNDKILDLCKFKELADENINEAKKLKFVSKMIENILGKGENAGNQHFLLFPKCFQKPPFSTLLKVGIVW